MLVVDASAIVAALALDAPDQALVARLRSADRLEAPHLVDLEFLHALRGLVRGNELTDDRAIDARSDLVELAITRYSHEPLADRIWELRHNLTAYDAAFVALAEALSAPLITCDAGLAWVPGIRTEIELY